MNIDRSQTLTHFNLNSDKSKSSKRLPDPVIIKEDTICSEIYFVPLSPKSFLAPYFHE